MTGRMLPAESQLADWKVYTVAAPVLILIISWAAAEVIFPVPLAFRSTFGTGDLLPLASFILLGASADVDHDSVYGQPSSSRLQKLKRYSLLLAILCLVFFGLIKGKALSILVASPIPAPDQEKLLLFARFSIICLVLAVTLSLYTKTKLVKEQLDREPET